MDFESQIEKIAKDIRDRDDREMALAFTNVVGSLLRENGVFVKTSRYEFETDNETHNETDKNTYIIKKEYGVSVDGLDFTEHDKKFKDEIASLKRQIEKLENIRTRCHESAESEEEMKDWQVSYYLGDMFHCYVIEAENEYDATLKLLNSIPKGSHKLFRDLKVARKKVDWN